MRTDAEPLGTATRPCDEPDAPPALAKALDVPPVVARLLCHRGLDDAGGGARFLAPLSITSTIRSLLTDLGVAVERLCAAVARKERIAIHGDYDVDGVTSTVILRRALELLGGDVDALPARNGCATATACSGPPSSACTPTACGSSCRWTAASAAREAARRARELGIDLIITDHHEPEATLPRGARGDQPEAGGLPLSRQAPRRRRRRAQDRPGAVPAAPAARSGCRRS